MLQPNPPQKPPRKLQGVSAHFESLPRSVGRQAKGRHTSDYTNFELLTTQQQQQPSSTGYEMVYLARTGSPHQQQGGNAAVSPRFRIQNTEQYVDMERQPSSYENVVLPELPSKRISQSTNVDEDSTYDIPRELGGHKTYENVIFNQPADRSPTPPPSSTSRSGSTSTSCSSSSSKCTPDSPSCLTHLPPTPDHPPPTAHMAEQSIHQRMRPLSEVIKKNTYKFPPITDHNSVSCFFFLILF